MAVITTGFPAAMYSNNFRGEVAWVMRLSWKGMVATEKQRR